MRGAVLLVVLVVVLAAACSGVDVKSILPIQGPESPPTAEFDVLRCTVRDGRAEAEVRFTVDQPVGSVEFRSDYTAADGTVIGRGSAIATDVEPDRAYRVVIVHALDGADGGGTCHVALGTIRP